jgi:hypothetical protein
MKSQKQNNKAPRPFKNNSTGGWSGGRGTNAFIPPPKPSLLARKNAVQAEGKTPPPAPDEAAP